MTPEPKLCCTRWRISGEAPKSCEKKRIVEEGIDLNLGYGAGIDIDHRRRDALDHRAKLSCTWPMEAGGVPDGTKGAGGALGGASLVGAGAPVAEECRRHLGQRTRQQDGGDCG